MCTDDHGDVFMTEIVDSTGRIVEYAHGGTHPIATLTDPGYPMGCSVDPTTGDLAVANFATSSQSGGLAIYKSATGNPTSFTDPSFHTYSFCGYDDQGNLFVDGIGPEPSNSFKLAELAKRSSSLTTVTLLQQQDMSTSYCVLFGALLTRVT